MTLEPLKELERLQIENAELKKWLAEYEKRFVCDICEGSLSKNNKNGTLYCEACLQKESMLGL